MVVVTTSVIEKNMFFSDSASFKGNCTCQLFLESFLHVVHLVSEVDHGIPDLMVCEEGSWLLRVLSLVCLIKT